MFGRHSTPGLTQQQLLLPGVEGPGRLVARFCAPLCSLTLTASGRAHLVPHRSAFWVSLPPDPTRLMPEPLSRQACSTALDPKSEAITQVTISVSTRTDLAFHPGSKWGPLCG